jgi:hypothetical protein
LLMRVALDFREPSEPTVSVTREADWDWHAASAKHADSAAMMERPGRVTIRLGKWGK